MKIFLLLLAETRMFCWEGCLGHWLYTAIVPFLFLRKHLCNSVNTLLSLNWCYIKRTLYSEKDMDSFNAEYFLEIKQRKIWQYWIIRSRDMIFKVFIKFCEILMSPSQVGNCTMSWGAQLPIGFCTQIITNFQFSWIKLLIKLIPKSIHIHIYPKQTWLISRGNLLFTWELYF